MPERVLWTRHVGMEALNSVGSTGSCDSMESISSNHSAFSADSYDHLSAEERECLMFLEETIESLDNEDDSGLSNDESETIEKDSIVPKTEPAKIPPSTGDVKTSNKNPDQPQVKEKVEDGRTVELDLNKITIPKQAYHSFPRIVQVPKEEISKNPSDKRVTNLHSDPGKALYGKPRSLTSINQKNSEEITFPDLHLLPPPEPFQDTKIVDKRRSVNDPTDAREVQFGKTVAKFPYISEFKEVAPAVNFSHTKLAPPNVEIKIPRVKSPQRLSETVITGSYESLNHSVDNSSDGSFKQGPPTAPKPRKFPPHIMIKPSMGGGVASNTEPEPRPRAFSAHERNPERATESINAKLSQSKEHESARREALQKLGLLQEKANTPAPAPIKPSVFPKSVDISVPQGVMEHGKKDAYGKSVAIMQQEKSDILSTSPNKPSVVDLQRRTHPSDEAASNKNIVKNRLSVKSNSLEKSDDLDGGSSLPPREVNALDNISSRSVKSDDISRERFSLKAKPQEKVDDKSSKTTHALREVHTVIDASSKHVKHYVIENTPSGKVEPQKTDEVVIKPTPTPRHSLLVTDGSTKNVNSDINKNPTNLRTNTPETAKVFHQVQHPVVPDVRDRTTKADKSQENRAKVGSFENISIMSTSPGKPFSFPRPKDISIPHTSPEVTLRDGKGKAIADKNNRHSSHINMPSEPFLHLSQGSVPGLRQINIKSNTLERSGVGLSSAISGGENQSQKGSSSFFKKPMFSANFLRNTRPRPASLGTGKDFSAIEEPSGDTEKTEGRRFFFSKGSRPTPVTSVKITPKGSTDEHRREALLKLGILKE